MSNSTITTITEKLEIIITMIKEIQENEKGLTKEELKYFFNIINEEEMKEKQIIIPSDKGKLKLFDKPPLR